MPQKKSRGASPLLSPSFDLSAPLSHFLSSSLCLSLSRIATPLTPRSSFNLLLPSHLKLYTHPFLLKGGLSTQIEQCWSKGPGKYSPHIRRAKVWHMYILQIPKKITNFLFTSHRYLPRPKRVGYVTRLQHLYHTHECKPHPHIQVCNQGS